ncbi:MAG: hypothetical protein FJ267_07200 [Planctomycetes bacterium]|nr:hypothetical protein [Planctomycetota bacterium]
MTTATLELSRRRGKQRLYPQAPHQFVEVSCPCQKIRDSLARSGYSFDGVYCWSDGETVTLSGSVSRYFLAQVALETARKYATGYRIANEVEVIPCQQREQWVA